MHGERVGKSGLFALVVCLAAAGAVGPARAADEARVVVPSFVGGAGVEAGVADVLTELLLDALLNRHGVRAFGPSDLKELLTAEQQRMLMGCSDDGCMAQIAGALGARRLVAGQVGRLGSLYVLTLKLIDSEQAKVVSRASMKISKIEEAADAVGPLVDRLLGSRPKRASAVPAFQTEAPAAKKEPKDPRVFCREIEAYLDRLKTPPYAEALMELRRGLLEDLLATRFQRDFDEKRGCYWDRQRWRQTEVRREMLRARTEPDALDARRRLAESIEMARNVEVLQEAWLTGLAKEKSGAGRRPDALPFPVREGMLSPAPDGDAGRRLAEDWAGATKVLARALAAARKGDEAGFVALFTPDDPKRSRTSPGYVYDSVRSGMDGGYAIDPCPRFILAGSELEDRLEAQKEDGHLEVCVRKIKDDWVSTDDLYMVRTQDDGWRIERW